ncbi:pyruvate formate lyase-activating protein [Clostridium sp. 19966]|uniref:pyruvate formate-lyase-activating protein n=1 Tax=Clostridium sp. 19966 TaxID=2768166 RepID=UPI0028E046C6|nr:pyruvate formate-lyase-activating protein [Clostridium sp. 19966]MDT8716318.1 pyruvate formate lyase-activating protein [Clostridium sp. 19966]
MIGNIHSIESMGLVDGPGIRTVIFFQGCNLRCMYCHNPDTWFHSKALQIDSQDLIKKILRFKPYFSKSKGGVTFSGGEPLLQPEFLLEILKLCKENSIHTAIDTAGQGLGNYQEILKYTDLILFDIKHTSSKDYQSLTGGSITESENFLKISQSMRIPLWIRHVMVPEVTTGEKHMKSLAEKINSLKYVENIELLPYHTLGVNKYKALNINYRLDGVSAMSKEEAKDQENVLYKYLNTEMKSKLKFSC